MLPTIEEAEQILRNAESCNPGLWGNHSRLVAKCAKKIAMACENLNPKKAYILGLLHDIGRKFGTRHMGHVYDGYHYMMSFGYDEAARICLTHSFCIQDIDSYIGNFDITEQELLQMKHALSDLTYNDYDRLIQLCDCLAGGESILDIEARMEDVRQRYGSYPQEKWDKNLELKSYFEAKMGRDLYEVVKR